jgi:hypothetical protein
MFTFMFHEPKGTNYLLTSTEVRQLQKLKTKIPKLKYVTRLKKVIRILITSRY